MHRILALISLLLTSMATSPAPGTAVLIDFGEDAPCTFAEAQSLDDQYLSRGVRFIGGMEVVHECGNFGVLEHSAGAFLAWNSTNSGNEPEEVLEFASPVSNVGFLTGGREHGTVTATALDADGKVIAEQTVQLVSSAMPVSLSVGNISRVIITSTAVYGAIDDIRFTRM